MLCLVLGISEGFLLNLLIKAETIHWGLTEHTVFPEIDPSKAAAAHGLEITIVTTAGDPEKSKRLLELIGYARFDKGGK